MATEQEQSHEKTRLKQPASKDGSKRKTIRVVKDDDGRCDDETSVFDSKKIGKKCVVKSDVKNREMNEYYESREKDEMENDVDRDLESEGNSVKSVTNKKAKFFSHGNEKPLSESESASTSHQYITQFNTVIQLLTTPSISKVNNITLPNFGTDGTKIHTIIVFRVDDHSYVTFTDMVLFLEACLIRDGILTDSMLSTELHVWLGERMESRHMNEIDPKFENGELDVVDVGVFVGELYGELLMYSCERIGRQSVDEGDEGGGMNIQEQGERGLGGGSFGSRDELDDKLSDKNGSLITSGLLGRKGFRSRDDLYGKTSRDSLAENRLHKSRDDFTENDGFLKSNDGFVKSNDVFLKSNVVFLKSNDFKENSMEGDEYYEGRETINDRNTFAQSESRMFTAVDAHDKHIKGETGLSEDFYAYMQPETGKTPDHIKESDLEKDMPNYQPFHGDWTNEMVDQIIGTMFEPDAKQNFLKNPPQAEHEFNEMQRLAKTERSTTTTRPFVCHYRACNRAFKRFEHSKRHYRIHTGERPFKCKFPGCHKAFARSDNLNQHLRVHNAGASPMNHGNSGRQMRFLDEN